MSRHFPAGRIDAAELATAGGTALPDGKGVSLYGWQVETAKSAILSDARSDEVRRSLGNVLNVPEQLFYDNHLRLKHLASGLVLDFSAQDALRCWRELDLPPVQVGHAEQWTQARHQDIKQHMAVTLNYDWTYTTPYSGTVQPEAAKGSSASGKAATWEQSTEAIDKALLLSRDPILFYDEVPLYESELDDNGVSSLIVKVRVMPKCWFVLLRFWLRVDGVLVRLWETRVCGRFHPDSASLDVTREIRRSEGTFAELRRDGAPAEGPAYADADVASEALQAVAPTGVSLFQIEKLVASGQP
ncbi:hypothetical protein WJX73_003755 [Symbiochloris irregularis]|uniref:TIP41-like protein n=1 Tax=Symbiochloris irregularis TaxID=706552 RepID=A0AAW1PHX0_9CHLO